MRFVTFLIIIPIFSTWLFYIIGKKFQKYEWKAFRFAVNWTTIFYVIATNILLYQLFNQQFIGITVIVMLFLLAIILIIQRKKRTEVILWKGIKLLWRICFLIFFVVYILLIIYLIIREVLILNVITPS